MFEHDSRNRPPAEAVATTPAPPSLPPPRPATASGSGGGSPEAVTQAVGNYAEPAERARQNVLAMGLDEDDYRIMMQVHAANPPLGLPRPPSLLDRAWDGLSGLFSANEAAVQTQQNAGHTGVPDVSDAAKTAGDVMTMVEGATEIMQPGRASPAALGKTATSTASVLLPPLVNHLIPGAGPAVSVALDQAKAGLNMIAPGTLEHYVGTGLAAVRDTVFPASPEERAMNEDIALRERVVNERRAAEAAAAAERQHTARGLERLDAADPLPPPHRP